MRILRNGSKMIILGWDYFTRVQCKLCNRKEHLVCEGVTKEMLQEEGKAKTGNLKLEDSCFIMLNSNPSTFHLFFLRKPSPSHQHF